MASTSTVEKSKPTTAEIKYYSELLKTVEVKTAELEEVKMQILTLTESFLKDFRLKDRWDCKELMGVAHKLKKDIDNTQSHIEILERRYYFE